MDKMISNDGIYTPVVQAGGAVATVGIGIMGIVDMAGNILGLIALFTGILASLSIFLKNRAETKIMEEKEKARLEEIELREAEGLELRRKDDA